tara:strand:- start:421 stop:618 length:198 start_codon:yes stop_codon:yes gene_type:complete
MKFLEIGTQFINTDKVRFINIGNPLESDNGSFNRWITVHFIGDELLNNQINADEYVTFIENIERI